MSQLSKKPKTESQKIIRAQAEPNSSHELQEKYVHLQTMLMLSQLNATFYELRLSLQKATGKLEKKYFDIKMKAFLLIAHYQPDYLTIKAQKCKLQQIAENSANDQQIKLLLQDDQLVIKYSSDFKIKSHEELQCQLVIKCSVVLERIANLMLVKKKSILGHALHCMMIYNQASTMQINSQKSSKLETNDSQKSKIFKRSLEKTNNRKSFSLQKSGAPSKHEYYVPVKYQPSKISSPLVYKPEQSFIRDESINSSTLNKFLHERGDLVIKDRKNHLMTQRDKNSIKYNSSQKYHNNTNVLHTQRDEKIKQFESLRKKYKKLVAEFTWFSQRFLKVIQEEDYVK